MSTTKHQTPAKIYREGDGGSLRLTAWAATGRAAALPAEASASASKVQAPAPDGGCRTKGCRPAGLIVLC
jgi:hypothetical protein